MSYLQVRKRAKAIGWDLIVTKLATKRTKARFDIRAHVSDDLYNTVYSDVTLVEAAYLIDDTTEQIEALTACRTIQQRHMRLLTSIDKSLTLGEHKRAAMLGSMAHELKHTLNAVYNQVVIGKAAE